MRLGLHGGAAVNVLIIANHFAVASGRYAQRAFERLGHDVRTVGPAHGRNIWGLQVKPEHVWEPMPPEAGWTPDMVVVMDSDPAILNTVQGFSCPVYVWGVDNHVRDYRRAWFDNWVWFDHYFLAHRNVSVMDWRDDMTHLPCGYDPVLHTPSEIPYNEREFDVCMIGVMYPQRWELVQALKAAGLKVLAGTGLVYEDYVAAYHNSRIALNLSAAGDVAQRVFETAAMGNVVMSDACADYTLLKPDSFWLIDDTRKIVDETRAILSEPDEAQRMIERSQAWVQAHTWDARAQAVVDWHKERTDG